MAVEQAILPDWATMTPGPGLAARLATLDPNAVPDNHLVPLLQARWRQVNHDNAQYLATITHLQQRLDDPWTTVAEVAAGLRFTDRRADTECLLAHQLAHRLPQVWAALNHGAIDIPKARIFAQYLGDDTDSGPTDTQVTAICRRLLPKTPGWTTGQLAARLLREVLAIDPAFTRRRYQRAARDRGVWGYCATRRSVISPIE